MDRLINSILKFVPKPFLIVLWVILVFLIGVLDYYTRDYSLIVLYAVLVAAVTILLGWWNGIAVSVLSSVIGLFSDQFSVPRYGSIQPFFNAGMTFIVYLMLTMIVDRLSISLANVKNLSRMDFLTGALNLRYFTELLEQEIERSKRSKKPFSFAFIDLDDFKSVNDNSGHSAGDDLLKRIVLCMRHSVRNIDHVARIGGDEFGVLFPDTNREHALTAMKRLKEDCTADLSGTFPDITLSAGLVTFARPPKDPNEVIRIADSLMYRAKKNGKDRIVRSSR